MSGPLPWSAFAAAEPAFAERVSALFSSRRHHTLATLRRDGSPRISGIEVTLGPDLVLGMMPGSLKALDLLRDPRLALHSATEDPPRGAPSSWPGEAKLAGVAFEAPLPEDASGHSFHVLLSEVVITRVAASGDHLVIESWHPSRGFTERSRF